MSRVIKFRAWRDKQKFMLHTHSLVELFTYGQLVNPDGVVWMQFTGLKDKHGVEIYEGDVVKSEQEKHYWMSVISSESGLGGSNLYAMEFCNNVSFSECGEFYTYEKQPSARRNNIHSRMEVIGNIHQNPELLK